LEAFKLKDAIIKLLEENANGRYNVVSPQNRKSDAESIFQKPQVTVYYAEGSFDKSKSSVNSPYHHDTSFNIHVHAAAKVKINLAVLNNPAATPEQLAEALNSAGNASMEVDAKIDALLSALYDIIMRPQNRNLGTDYITNRWVSKIGKRNPEPIGAIVTGVATITLIAQCEEEVTGEEGTPGITIDTVVEFGDDSNQGAKT
jgi:hypothetical protein